ncbi:MAG: ornithine carbamoyltransferase [Clostridiales bacterium]|jgi:ornithine carbamoyltransferase|nr:ornithine carbamoyltransferase [Clostridiales bacterium]
MKDLLKILDLSKEEILEILNLADQMKYESKNGIAHRVLEGKTLAMIFQKSSTRTRVSFEVGMYQLGGYALFLTHNDLQIGRGEPVEDTSRVLSRYVNGIMTRTFAQEEVESLAKWSCIPVINGLTDFEHPCQILADLMTIREYHSALEGVKIGYIGDGNNVCNSLIAGALKCGMKISVATPKGYEPHADTLAFAKGNPDFVLTTSPEEAAKDADVLYTDVWASMGMEEEAQQRMKAFAGFQVNDEIMNLAHPKAIVQHCLPAHRGEEITAEVFEAHANPIFDEAENRLHAQKAIMAMLMG